MQIECRPSKPLHKPGRPNALPLPDMAPGDWFEAPLNWNRAYNLVWQYTKATGRRFVLTHAEHRSANYLGTLTDSGAPPVLVRCERIAHDDGRRAVGDPKRKRKPKAAPAIDRKRAASAASIAALKARRAVRAAMAAGRYPDIFA